MIDDSIREVLLRPDPVGPPPADVMHFTLRLNPKTRLLFHRDGAPICDAPPTCARPVTEYPRLVTCPECRRWLAERPAQFTEGCA